MSATPFVWNTRLKAFTRIPIVGAPMAGHSGGVLVATVYAAGGLYFISGGHWLSKAAANEEMPSGLERLQCQIELFRQTERDY